MTKTCPVPTPAERRFGAIQSGIEEALVKKVDAALREAAEQARRDVEAAELALPPPSRSYFTAMLHQRLYCILCEADPQTFSGGRPELALAVIRNSQRIAKHHWGADIELGP